MINLDKYDIIGHEVICDFTNNSEEDRKNGVINLDIYFKVRAKEPIDRIQLDVEVTPEGDVIFGGKDSNDKI